MHSGLRIAVWLGCLSAGGCLGGTQNPSYAPYYLPTGDIIRTHAKPGGLGYFADFDRKAKKLEVTPTSRTNPTNTQQVLIAKVVDADGDARRGRRVEWILDGPGYIVEVDESGRLPGRGYKVDNKYAVSYTDYLEHTITRGNNDPADDFTIKPGHTWCVVSSAVEGLTTVTAYAPEVHEWDAGRQVVKLTWADDGFAVKPNTARTGGSTSSGRPDLMLDVKVPPAAGLTQDLTTSFNVTNRGSGDGQPVTVRATLPDTAELVRTDPPAKRTGRELVWTLPAVSAGRAQAATLVVKPSRRGSLEFAATAETADGLKAEQRASVSVDTAGVGVDVAGTGDGTVRVTVRNTGAVQLTNAVAWVSAPGLKHASGAEPVEVPVGTVDADRSKSVEVTFTAARSGSYPVTANVVADGGLTARGTAKVAISRSELAVRVIGPETVPVGQEAMFEVRVTNAGDGAVSDVKVTTDLPPSLSAAETTQTLGSLGAGETKMARLTVRGEKLSTAGTVSARASADVPNGRPVKADASATVAVTGMPVLTLELADPAGPITVGGRASYRVVVRNRGTAPATAVDVAVELSPEFGSVRGVGPRESKGASDGRRVRFGGLDELPPGGSMTFVVDGEAVTAGDGHATATVRAAGLARPLQEEQRTRVVSR